MIPKVEEDRKLQPISFSSLVKVSDGSISQCGNLRISPPRFFRKYSVKLTFSLKIYIVTQFDEKLKWGKINDITTL